MRAAYRSNKIKNSDRYIEAMRQWLHALRAEPHALMAGSLWFVLTALPVLSFGIARIALTYYMRQRALGIQTTWKEARRFATRTCGARAWLLGLSDLLVLILTGGCFLGITQPELPIFIRFFYGLMLMLDGLYLLSGLYRYPILVREPDLSLSMLVSRALLITVGTLGWTLMLHFASFLAFLICAFSGVGLFLLYPAASALLSACAYAQMLEKYREELDLTQEEDDASDGEL